MGRLLAEIEAAHDVEIIYAAECGALEWSLALNDTKPRMCLIYMHNNASWYATPHKYGFIFGHRNDLCDWSAFDIVSATNWTLANMYTREVEALFARKVYKKTSRFNFVEHMRQLLSGGDDDDENSPPPPWIGELLHNYRQRVQTAVAAFDRNRDGKVPLDDYLATIRKTAVVQWLIIKHISRKKKNSPTTYFYYYFYESKLVETNFNVLMDDIREEIGDEMATTLADFYSSHKDRSISARVDRLKKIDQWMSRTLKESDKHVKKNQANSKQHLDVLARQLYAAVKPNLLLKFGNN